MKFMGSIFKAFTLSLCIIANTHLAYAQTASILPPAKTTFFDSNGNPLTAGTVTSYIPATTTKKTTWQDAAETIPNANPLTLDAAGRALILGSGSYRQVVKDKLGNLIWDQVTSSTGSGGSGPIATGDGDLVGTIKPWAGMTAPNQYAFTYGQEISRATFATLFTAITSSQSVFCTSGSPVLTGLADTTNFGVGAAVEVSCLASGASTIVNRTDTTITLAANANVTTNTTAIIFPWGRGNGTTTFNLPDFRGLIPLGNNKMGGVASSNIDSPYFGGSVNSIGSQGGGSSIALSAANLPPQTPSGTVTNGGITSTPSSSFANNGTLCGVGTGATIGLCGQTSLTVSSTQATSTFTGTAFTGQISAPFSRLPPSKTTNFIIKTTPDTNSASVSGVTSLGGMTGDIACGGGLLCTGNIISVGIGAGFLLAANNLSDVQSKYSSLSNITDAQFIGVQPENFGALRDGASNDTRYFIDAANSVYGFSGRRSIALSSGGGGYAITPIQFGGSYQNSGTFIGTITGGTTLTVTGNPTIFLAPGQSLTCGTCAANTVITAYQGNTVGLFGTYTIAPSQADVASSTITATAPSFTADITGTTMTVTAIANGKITAVDSLVGTSIIGGNTVASFGSGTGGVGTYTLAYSQPTPLTGVAIRSYPYTVAPIPNALVGGAGGQTGTIISAFGAVPSAQSVIKIVAPPAIGAVLGFEIGNFRVNANSVYRGEMTFHGFSTTTSGGVPWAHDISVLGGTGCGINILGDAPALVSWGIIESAFHRISSTFNAGCGFNFDGNSGTANYNSQSIDAASLKANGNGGNGFIFDWTNLYCAVCLAQSNGGVGFAADNVNYMILPSFYTEGNVGGAVTGTANTKGVHITGQLEESVNAVLQTCGTCDIDINSSLGRFRNGGEITTHSALVTPPTAGTGIIGASPGAGLQLVGRGSTYDTSLYNWGGSIACGVITGTQRLSCSAFDIGGQTITLAGNFAISGAFATTLNVTGATSVTLPTSGTLLSTAGLGANINTWLATPSSTNLRAAVTDESGTGALLFQNGNIGAATGTSVALSSFFTSSADGASTVIGPGGTGVLNSTLLLDGGSGAASGAQIVLRKNSVSHWRWASQSIIAGSGTSNDSTIQNIVTGNSVLGFGVSDDSTTVVGPFKLGTSGKLAISQTAPSAVICTGSTIPASNGTAAFTIGTGTGCAGSTGTITLPAATAGWVCDFHNATVPASNIVEMTGGSTTTVTITNYARTTGVSSNFTDSHLIRAKCTAY